LQHEPPPFPLFSDLPREAFLELLARMSVVRLGPGEMVLREGEAGDACYLIASGRVRVTKAENAAVARQRRRSELRHFEEGAVHVDPHGVGAAAAPDRPIREDQLVGDGQLPPVLVVVADPAADRLRRVRGGERRPAADELALGQLAGAGALLVPAAVEDVAEVFWANVGFAKGHGDLMERELSEMLGYYLDREYDLDALQGALAELTWSNLEAPRVAHRIEFLIGEAIDGRLGGDELRTELDQVRRSLLLAQA